MIILVMGFFSFAQEYQGAQASKRFKGAEMIRMKPGFDLPDFIRLNKQSQFDYNSLNAWLSENYDISSPMSSIQYRTEDDKRMGMLHYRNRQTYQGVEVWDATFIAHTKEGKVQSLNGRFYKSVIAENSPLISEKQALAHGLEYMKASVYKWEIPGEDKRLQELTGDAAASYYPKGKLVLLPTAVKTHRYCYLFNIYAAVPLKRLELFVDAQTGAILKENNKIYEADTTGTAVTKYLGIKKIKTDLFNETIFRLRETGRGNGIETYNLLQGSNYGNAVDFIDSNNYWNNVNPQKDEIATDGHYGAEMTYDYFKVMHNRNSIDNLGYKLKSYVHYNVAYSNAFWDGQVMTYGDGGTSGGQTFTPFTALDICGHEITHGLDEFTANLTYSYESGALNEGYSDIFGTMVEFYGDTIGADWLIGEDIGQAFRSMSNPNQFQLPDTYLGTHWATGGGDNGGVHTNSGVICFWFYLTAQGGSGTNDINNSYNVIGIGKDKASDVAFRTLTVWLDANSQYADARFYSIQSATELFGSCSPEVQTVTNAMYAVGIGNAFSPGVSCDFNASAQSFCTLPATVNFSNNTNNAIHFNWDFGDGGSDTLFEPTHNFAFAGTFSVKLTADGGACGSDTLQKINYITVNPPSTPLCVSASICGGPAALTLTASAPDSVRWYTSPSGGTPFFTGTSYTTPVLSTTQKYYVENQVVSPHVFTAKTNNTTGGSYYTNFTSHYESFDVMAPVTIKSVKVYAGTAGTRSIELRDSQGNVLTSTNINIPAGESRINLNFNVPTGIGYRLAGPSNPDLYRDKSGCAYPYTVAGLLSVTGSSAGGANTYTYYYYFYDWEVVPQPCTSERVLVAAYVNAEVPTPNFSATLLGGLSMSFHNTSIESNTFLWNFGDGQTSTLENPVHTYANYGSYAVTLTVYNACGTNSITHNENITLGISSYNESKGLHLLPNPAKTYVRASFSASGNENAHIMLLDMLGRTVWTQELNIPGGIQDVMIPLEGIDSGMYTVVVVTKDGTMIQKLLKE